MIVSENNNTKGAAPPADPPPPPPADVAGSHQHAEFSFNLELTNTQHEQYGTQFALADMPAIVAPSVTIVGKFSVQCVNEFLIQVFILMSK